MSNIKKLLIITITLFITLFIGAQLLSVNAINETREKNPKAVTNSQKNRNIDTTDIEDENETPEPEELLDPEPSRGNSAGVRLENALRKLERLQTKINDPEVGEQVQETTQNQAEANLQIQEKLQTMEARPGFLKFILGPDYKNAGQVRSAVVRLQNQERQMLKIRGKLSDPDDISTINEAIQTVQGSVTAYQQMLSEKLAGFSLFGWLFRFMSGYTPTSSPMPTITVSPSIEASPSATPEATQEPTAEPTETPTLEPTATP